MLIEIRGTGTHNKGAELMLQTILQQVQPSGVCPKFVVERWFGSWEDRARYGLRTLLPEKGFGRAALVSRLMSSSFRLHYGVVLRKDLHAVLDASGFSYGDQWGLSPLAEAAAFAEELQRRGRPYILMPQAFGPFSTPRMQETARRLIDASTLVFAREQTSLSHLRALGVESSKLLKAHDFTILCKPELPSELNLPEKFGCIVPNVRMLDKASAEESTGYVRFLVKAVNSLRERGVTPIFLYHDPKSDVQVADRISAELPERIEAFSFSCPRILKGIIGQSQVVIGSRFHALVGALCQGVPVIATSWSHKYEELLGEYGVAELLLQPSSGDERVAGVLRSVLDDPSRSDIVRRLKSAADRFRIESQQMFQRVNESLKTLN